MSPYKHLVTTCETLNEVTLSHKPFTHLSIYLVFTGTPLLTTLTP